MRRSGYQLTLVVQIRLDEPYELQPSTRPVVAELPFAVGKSFFRK